MTAFRVLLIGENRELVAMTGRLLRRSGYQTDLAVGTAEARQQLLQHTPQLIVMNCSLPDGDGICFCHQLRQDHLPARILLTSNDSADEVRAFEAGADDFVKKPYHVEVLLARLHRLAQIFAN